MKLMKRAVAVALMALLAAGVTACEQKKETTEAVPAEKAAPAVEQKAPAAEVQAPAQEAQPPVEEELQPAEEENLADVPSPDSEPQPEEAPAAAPAGEQK
jgi:PBP1b-binding outer membrane lipoprotein LpoB